MSKWQDVVDDVCINRGNARRFVITDLEMKSYANRRQARRKNNVRAKSNCKVYYFGEDQSQIYFTQREVECIYLLMKNYRVNKIADLLKISPRTVEFYIKNIKSKLNAPSRKVLIETIANTDFMARIEIDKQKSINFQDR